MLCLDMADGENQSNQQNVKTTSRFQRCITEPQNWIFTLAHIYVLHDPHQYFDCTENVLSKENVYLSFSQAM